MQATARAQPNIALIKYWGKRDPSRNLPAVGSISITLESLFTEMRVTLDDPAAGDRLTVDGAVDARMLPRLSACLDSLLGDQRPAATIESRCNLPIAAGLASSASAFAALVVAAAAAAGMDRDRQALAREAGRASGSAARSLFGGFVELENEGESIAVKTLADAEQWPLSVVVAITTAERKPVGSTEAMELSRKTSPFYSRWIEDQPVDLETARSAIARRDFAMLGAVAEHNCLKMHSVMWASRPPLVYWNHATLNCMQTVRSLQADGVSVFFTIDAGPQVKAVCLPDALPQVEAALGATEGVVELRTTGLGAGAALVE